ncbi:hypothetical protein [Streptomyces carpinensis]|uniref:Secreted protein n=1 Tax=Streptomyces carpinensis TaxID=66369 RepID=A0ABV1WH53_9ACTN|nr:hypothetical protein [Streptomyces carpinensis]
MDRGGVRRRLALGLAVLTGSVTLALALPGAAQAAASTCSGREVRTLPFSTGSVHVYRQGGYLCAVTTPDHPGRKQAMSVTVQARGNRPVTDKGRYSYHAGPVTVHAGHRCVRVGGSVGSGSVRSGWILC